MAERINEQQFQEKILAGEGVKIAEFYSDTCIPCKRMAPLLAELEEAHNIYVGKINVAFDKALAEQWKVKSSPTLLFFKNGNQVERVTGAAVKKQQLEEIIKKYQK